MFKKCVLRKPASGFVKICSAVFLTTLSTILISSAAEIAAVSPTPKIIVTSDHANGVYSVGEKIRWQLEVTDSPQSPVDEIRFALKEGGLTVVCEGRLALESSRVEIETSMDHPGTLLLQVKLPGSEFKGVKGIGGVVVAPQKIKASAPRPKDFDSFWKSKLKEMSKVPPNPQLVSMESDKAGADYWQITLDNIRGTHVRGQISRPSAPGKAPAMLIVQGAGVYPLEKSWVTHRGAKGWIALNINAHDLPIDESPQFYTNQIQGPLKNYWTIGNDDREASYFLRMYLACYRAAEYLTQRPDWDGKTFLVIGTSQGGLQSLVTAALHSKVTAAIALVPGGCDLTGAQVGRTPGWPVGFLKNSVDDKILEASRYYDVVNFASRIKCPVLVGAGLADELCPAEGIVAAVNQIKAPKEIILLADADHMGVNGTHKPFNTRSGIWQNALRDGKPVPVQRNEFWTK